MNLFSKDHHELTGTLPTEFGQLQQIDSLDISEYSKNTDLLQVYCTVLIHCTFLNRETHIYVCSRHLVVSILIHNLLITCIGCTHQTLNCSSNMVYNDLTGTIPTEFGQIKELKEL